MTSNQGEILGVPASLSDIKKSYGVLSRFYAVAEGIFERGLRRKGLGLLSPKPGEVVLEIGFGRGYSLREIASSVGEEGQAYGVDVTPQMMKSTRKMLEKAGLVDRVILLEGDARRMPYEDSKFDAVYIANTLELFDTPDISRVLQEIKRVLKPDGRLCVASLSKEGREGSLFVKLYEWLHRKFPKYANCRPIYPTLSLENAGYRVLTADEFTLAGLVPWQLVLAKPENELSKMGLA